MLAASWLLGAGCASKGQALRQAVVEINGTLDIGPTRVLPGDSIRASFPDRPDWAQTVRVRPDGKASLSSVGDLAVAGLSIEELSRRVKEAYATIYPQLQLHVDVDLDAPRNVYVMGEVQRPGEFAIQGRLTLLEALAMAGGHRKETALLEHTLLVRWSREEQQQRAWRINAAVADWDESDPLLLQPHDVIFVPNKPIDKVNIWVDQYIRQMIPVPYLIPPVN